MLGLAGLDIRIFYTTKWVGGMKKKQCTSCTNVLLFLTQIGYADILNKALRENETKEILGGHMEINKSFIVDDSGNIKSVVLDYQSYQKIEALLLDFGLAKAMEEVEDDEEFDLEDAKLKLHYRNEGKI